MYSPTHLSLSLVVDRGGRPQSVSHSQLYLLRPLDLQRRTDRIDELVPDGHDEVLRS